MKKIEVQMEITTRMQRCAVFADLSPPFLLFHSRITDGFQGFPLPLVKECYTSFQYPTFLWASIFPSCQYFNLTLTSKSLYLFWIYC